MANHFTDMRFVVASVLFAYCARVQCETVDVIQMIGDFPKPTAVLTSSATFGEATLQCLYAVLTQYDPDAGNVAYVWYLRDQTGQERGIPQFIWKGDSPDHVNQASSDDPTHATTVVVRYTDYKTCFVFQAETGLCLLWVNDDFKNDVPEECIGQYKENCGEGILLYTKDICNE